MAIPPLAGADSTSDSGQAPLDRNDIHNEQTKLKATLFNTVAAGFAIAGVITPLASARSNVMPVNDESIMLMAIWIVSAFILHSIAQLTLEALR